MVFIFCACVGGDVRPQVTNAFLARCPLIFQAFPFSGHQHFSPLPLFLPALSLTHSCQIENTFFRFPPFEWALSVLKHLKYFFLFIASRMATRSSQFLESRALDPYKFSPRFDDLSHISPCLPLIFRQKLAGLFVLHPSRNTPFPSLQGPRSLRNAGSALSPPF